jgi:hypothetical protein
MLFGGFTGKIRILGYDERAGCLSGMGKREVNTGHALRSSNLKCPVLQRDHRSLSLAASHDNRPRGYSAGEARAQGLGHGFLGREPGRITLRRTCGGLAHVDFIGREDPLKKPPRVRSPEDPFHTADLDHVHADSDDHGFTFSLRTASATLQA